MKNEMPAKCGLTWAPRRRGILTFVMSLGLVVCPLTLAAQSVTLAWDPSPSPTVTGYMLYYSADGTNFDSQMDAGTNTTWTVTGLEPGSTNYFEVVAYDANNKESPPSNQIEYTVPNAAQTVTVLANPATAGGVTGGGSFAAGSSVTVTATANDGYTFANWTENGTVQSTSPSYSFTLATNCNLIANFTADPVNYTIAVSASPGAGGTVGGGGTFAADSSVTVTAAANSGYTFANWTENGTVQSTSPNYNFALAANCNLIANFTANPVIYTIAVSASPGAGGTVGGGGTFASGSSETVTAAASSGYTFTNWTMNGSVVSSSGSYTFTVTGNQTLVANFTANPVNYTIAVSASPAAGGTVGGGGTFASGSSQTVTATANSGYTFTNWTMNGSVVSSSGSYTFTVTGNQTLVANFTANPVNYTIAVSASPGVGGTVGGGGTFASGSSQTVTATASSGYTFTNWTMNGSVVSSSGSYTFTVTGNQTLVANFTANPVNYTVAVSASPGVGGTVGGGGTFASGSSQTVTATASSGYTFTNWTENGTVQSASPNYSFTLATNRNLVANFATNPVTYTVATQINPPKSGSVTGGGSFAAGSSVTVTATANSGYTFTNWTENGTVQSASPDYSFTLATNRNLVANFTTISVTTNLTTNSVTYTVTSSAGNNGSINPNGLQTVATGGSITFTAAPASGYQVNQWLVNGTVAQTGGSAFTLQNVTTNNAVAVTFSANPAVVTNSVVPATVQSNANTNFTLLISGNGTLAPSRTVKALQADTLPAGKKYTLTATAAKGSVFAGWVSNGIVVATTPRYTFLVESNLVLQADFIPNPFIPLVGTYHGLFYVTNDAAEESSGSFVATVTKTGAFSAKLCLGAGSYSYSGEFSLTGLASKSIQRPGLTPITVELQLGLTNGPLTGAISDGAWTADLVADVAVYSKANPAPQAGKYTLLIPGSENASAQPGGNGFGAVTVSESGNVTFSGILGDGTPVTSTSIVSSEGQWPFYASLYGGKGSILGWLSFTNEGVISGQTGWFKQPQATAKLYPGGFTNSAEAIGSIYQYTNGLPLLGFTEGQLSLTNGNLAQSITNQIVLGADNQATDPGGDKLTFKPSSGLFKGSVMNPATGKPITVNGVVLQNQHFGAGYFLGTTESGSVLLTPTQ
jgi:hypothetical protein